MRYLVLLFLVSSLFGFNYEISMTEIKNGETAIIKFEKDKDIKYKSIEILGKSYEIYDNYALVPISYYEEPKVADLIVNYLNKNQKQQKIIKLKIVDGGYKKEKIHVQKSKIELSSKDKERAAIEYKEAIDIYNKCSEQTYVSSKFIMPLNSKITSEFGKARIYNDTLNGYHSGTDFRAKVGTPLISSNDGVVVLVKDRFYSGGSVVIDHGHGVYLCYAHMSSFDVKQGDKVKKGQVIGLSGDTGRVTGPHLHFSARVGGVQVDPLQLMNVLNENILRK